MNITAFFVVHKLIDFVLAGESFNLTGPVLVASPAQIVCHANIQCAISLTCQDVNIGLLHQAKDGFRLSLSRT